jgi:hypothetical protein
MTLPINKRTVKLGKEEVELDSKKLEFNEATLSEFMDRLAVWYDYYGQKLAEAEAILSGAELKYDEEYCIRYDYHKDEEGLTDKLSDSKSKLHPPVQAAKQAVLAAKFKVQQIKYHLKSWDKAHESAQNRGHTLRREMDKLRTDIFQPESSLDKEVQELVKENQRALGK